MNSYCDVLVVGAGTAGVCAATASARGGANTVLVEKEGFPGGTGVSGMHRSICGLYANTPNAPPDTLNSGIVRNVCRRLQDLSHGSRIKKIGKVYVLPFSHKVFLTVYSDLLKETEEKEKLQTFYNTTVTRIKKEQEIITDVTVRQSGKSFTIIPQVVIDCSGEGIVLKLSGIHHRKAGRNECQLSGYTVRLKGLENVDDTLSIKVPYYAALGVKEKKLPHHMKFTGFYHGETPREGYLKFSVDPAAKEKRDEEAQRSALLFFRYISKILEPFKHSCIVENSSRVIDREGPRLRGLYTLSENDVTGGRKFPDGVVKNAWPIEIWDQHKGPSFEYLQQDQYYEIPLRCLESKEISNLFCAGRCISVSHRALGSTRVMGTCMALGQEAGREAADRIKS